MTTPKSVALRPIDLLSPEEEAQLRDRSDVIGVLLVLHAWGVILAAMLLFVVWPNPFSYLLGCVVIGSRQLGLAILMHDAAHRLLCAHPKLNDFLGSWFCGDPVGADIGLYRPYHLKHHRFTQQREDPDWGLSAHFPIHRNSLWRKVLRDVLGVTGYQRRRIQFQSAMQAEAGSTGPERFLSRWKRLVQAERRFLLTNLVLWALLSLAGHPWLYLFLWVVPLLTWYQLVSRIRNIAEHAVVGNNQDALRNTRTTYTHLIGRALWAPYWVNYHLEHHLLIFTPCWKLPQAHRVLGEKGLHPNMEIAKSYWEVLRRATSNPDDAPKKGSGDSKKSSASII